MPVSRNITEAAFSAYAAKLVVDVAAIKAVAEVECGKLGGFCVAPDDRPRILFEPHWFRKFTNAIYDKDHPTISTTYRSPDYLSGQKMDQWARLNEAKALNPTAALKSASWGTFQIMGFNYNLAGWSDVQAFVDSMNTADGQLTAFLNFVKSNPPMATALKNLKWADFARLYNGSDYRSNAYDTKLEAAYKKFKAS